MGAYMAPGDNTEAFHRANNALAYRVLDKLVRSGVPVHIRSTDQFLSVDMLPALKEKLIPSLKNTPA